MFFKKKKSGDSKEGNLAYSSPVSSNNQDTEDDGEINIDDLEKIISENEGDPELVNILVGAGDAYAFGIYGAEKNMIKSSKYYKIAADLGDAYAQLKYGQIQIIRGLEIKDKMVYSLGVMFVCKSYRNKCEEAKETMLDIVESGYFEGAKTINDLLNIVKDL